MSENNESKKKGFKKAQETPLSLAKEVTEFFVEQFVISDVTMFGTNKAEKKREDAGSYRAIVCTLFDTRKTGIVKSASRILLFMSARTTQLNNKRQGESNMKRLRKARHKYKTRRTQSWMHRNTLLMGQVYL